MRFVLDLTWDLPRVLLLLGSQTTGKTDLNWQTDLRLRPYWLRTCQSHVWGDVVHFRLFGCLPRSLDIRRFSLLQRYSFTEERSQSFHQASSLLATYFHVRAPLARLLFALQAPREVLLAAPPG